jgi:hypothetical protein
MLAVAVAGCGLPTDDKPVVDGPGSGDVTQGEASPANPPDVGGPQTARSARELVEDYFAAPAVGPDRVVGLLKQFLTPNAQQSYEPTPTITVVKIDIHQTVGDLNVNVNVKPVGTLTPDGKIESTNSTLSKVHFHVFADVNGIDLGNHRRTTYYFDQVPAGDILLSTDALNRYYAAHTIYYWSKEARDNDTRTLVPDLRYIVGKPSPTQVVKWLQDEPADWLSGAVQKLPDNTVNTPPIETQSDHYVTRLSAGVTPGAARDIATQIRWSLGPSAAPVYARIDGVAQEIRPTDIDFASANSYSGQSAAGYAVRAGKIVQVGPANNYEVTPANTWPDVLHQADTVVAQAAAISRDQDVLALVVPEGNLLRLELARRGTKGVVRTSLARAAMSRPTFLGRSHTLLVVANGRLYRVAADPGRPVVDVSPDTRPLAAVQASPDGRRLLLVTTAGDVVLAAIDDQGRVDTGPRVDADPIDGTFSAVAAGWAGPNEVVLAGATRGVATLAHVAVNGTPLGRVTSSNLANVEIHGLAVRPADPRGSVEQVVLDATAGDGKRASYFAYSSDLGPWGVPPAQPSKPPTDNPDTRPIAPFYAG